MTTLKNKSSIQWHNLQKNPDDLPPDVGWVSNQDGLPCYYEWATERWLNCRDIEIKVTAWCDMPWISSD
jgi:hypothetical protein